MHNPDTPGGERRNRSCIIPLWTRGGHGFSVTGSVNYMGRPNHIPKHCEHKPTGRGFVRLDGKQVYTGRWGTQEAARRYERLVGEWMLNGRREAVPEAEAGSLLGLFDEWASHPPTNAPTAMPASTVPMMPVYVSSDTPTYGARIRPARISSTRTAADVPVTSAIASQPGSGSPRACAVGSMHVRIPHEPPETTSATARLGPGRGSAAPRGGR